MTQQRITASSKRVGFARGGVKIQGFADVQQVCADAKAGDDGALDCLTTIQRFAASPETDDQRAAMDHVLKTLKEIRECR